CPAGSARVMPGPPAAVPPPADFFAAAWRKLVLYADPPRLRADRGVHAGRVAAVAAGARPAAEHRPDPRGGGGVAVGRVRRPHLGRPHPPPRPDPPAGGRPRLRPAAAGAVLRQPRGGRSGRPRPRPGLDRPAGAAGGPRGREGPRAVRRAGRPAPVLPDPLRVLADLLRRRAGHPRLRPVLVAGRVLR